MPVFYVRGYNSARQVQEIEIECRVRLKECIYNHPAGDKKLSEIRDLLEKIVGIYFDDVSESDLFSNHEWNIRKENEYD